MSKIQKIWLFQLKNFSFKVKMKWSFDFLATKITFFVE